MHRARFLYAAPVLLVAVTFLTGLAGAAAVSKTEPHMVVTAGAVTPLAPKQSVTHARSAGAAEALPQRHAPKAPAADEPATESSPANIAADNPHVDNLSGEPAAANAAPAPNPEPASARQPHPEPMAWEHQIANRPAVTLDDNGDVRTASALDAENSDNPVEAVVYLDAADGTIIIEAVLAGLRGSADNVTVTATITNPDGTTNTVTFDFGTVDLDGTPNRQTSLYLPSGAGTYRAHGTVSYTTNS